jgi:hypothetical protein
MKILFIHHSTGANLLRQGHVRQLLMRARPDLEFSDHGYNLYPHFSQLRSYFTHHTGLRDADGHFTGRDFNIIVSNNSPREYADIFSRNPHDSTLHQILQYDVIIFKTCYPTTKIVSDEQLAEDKKFYEQIRESIKKYPDKIFILFTPPPLRKELTQPEFAQRAKNLVDWLISPEYVKNVQNLKIFDFFNLLAAKSGPHTNMLRPEFTRLITLDSHPNQRANKEVGKTFAEFLINSLPK